MIIADTNVVCELFRPEPDVRVIEWLEANPDVGTTAITVGELWVGIENLPDGRRKSGLASVADELFNEFFGDITDYDARAARTYGQIVAERRRQGRPISQGDAQIAAICLAAGATLATRNVKDFVGIELVVLDPWEM
ncbi:PIN domain-containing protein [Nocardia sp. FBN12]|uniref:type II toxin-antitoxin system VapC family toxin n=1 Tax=Nocardia sp. FBN12 TaxID=3419766 RepID=UPI003CFD1BCF